MPVPSEPIRRSLAQSTASSTRCSISAGTSRAISPSSRKWYSAGIGALPVRYITVSLPSSRSPSAAASIDPSASPSGFSWVTTAKRSWSRTASATALTSSVTRSVPVSALAICILGGRGGVDDEVVDQLRHAHAPLDRLIVGEGQGRRPAQAELCVDLCLQHAPCRLEPAHRGRALLLAAEDGDEHTRFAEIGRHDDTGDGHHPDARVLQPRDAFRDHGTDRLVDTAHAFRHGGNATSAHRPA